MDTAVLAVRTILSLAVVLGLIWYAGRRLNDSTSGRGGDGMLAGWVRKAGGVVGQSPAGRRRGVERPAPVVAVVGRQAVGPKASVAVVDVGGQRLVLGVSEAGVALLTIMEVPAAEASPVAEHAASAERPAPVSLIKSTRDSAPTQPDFDDVFAAATAAPRSLSGSILSPATWRQARSALRPGPTP